MTTISLQQHLDDVTAFFAAQPTVVAVALSGSQTRAVQDARSDLDLYVYVTADVSLEARRAFILPRASRAELQNTTWEVGDEWDDARDGQHFDVMYRWTDFIEGERRSLLAEHQGRVGYTTAVLAGVAHSRVLFDPTGWLQQQIAAVQEPYPAALAHAIIEKNWPLLGPAMGSFLSQLESAVARGDALAVNHRLAAYFASFTDVVFALNHQYHPGEKRLLTYLARLPLVPAGLPERVPAILAAPGHPAMLDRLRELTDDLGRVLLEQGHLAGRPAGQ